MQSLVKFIFVSFCINDVVVLSVVKSLPFDMGSCTEKMWNEYLLMSHMIQMTMQIKLSRALSLISDNLTENEREV